MLEGLDWQTLLLITVAALSCINGLSVLYNFRTDRPDVVIEPAVDDDWMWWSELIDETADKPVRRYIVIGNLGLTNLGRRATSIINTELRIRLRTLKSTASPLFSIPQPEVPIARAGMAPLTVMHPTPKDRYANKRLIQPGESIAGIHCFMFVMHGSDLWVPKTNGDTLEGTVEVEGSFGKCYKSKLAFEKVPLAKLETLFPTVETFMTRHLEHGAA